MEAEYTGQAVDLLRPIEVAAASDCMSAFAYKSETTGTECHPVPDGIGEKFCNPYRLRYTDISARNQAGNGRHTRRMTGRRILFRQVVVNFD